MQNTKIQTWNAVINPNSRSLLNSSAILEVDIKFNIMNT